MASAAQDARSVHGALNLRFARGGSRTTLAEVSRSGPWGLQRLLYLDPANPSLARAVLLNATAGLFAGDRLSLSITVDTGATVEVATTTQTRVYAMPDGEAAVDVTLHVPEEAYLLYLPEPLLLCRDAALDQRTTLIAGARAWAAIGEVVAFGRAGHGELHAYRRLALAGEVQRDGRLLLADALHLEADDNARAPGVTGESAAYGSLVCLCPDGRASALLEALRAVIGGQHRCIAGASLLQGEAGVCLRLLAPSASAAQQLLRSAAEAFRVAALGRGG